MSKSLLSRITPRHSRSSKSPTTNTITITYRIKKIVNELCHILTTRNTHWEQTLETRLSEEDIVPSDVAHQVFDKIRDVESALKFFNWISQRPYGCPLDGVAYSSLLKLLAKAKAFREIDSLFIRIKNEEEPPTHEALNDVIRAYSECGLIDKALDIYSFVVETYNCVPNVFACNSLLTGLVKTNRLETAFQVYNEMLHRSDASGTGCCADNYSTSIMANALCKKGKVEEAKKLISNRWGQGCIPNVVFYNTLIDGYCKKAKTYGAMINGLCKEGDFGIVERLMNEMKSRGLAINVNVYNSIIDAQCRHGCRLKAEEMFKEMIKIGCPPDIITYNILIYDSCSHGKAKEAEELMEQAARRGLRPNKLTFTPLLNAYCRQNDTEKAFNLFIKMIDSGEKPDLLTYGSLIHGFVVLGEVDTAMVILNKMIEKGVFPDAGIYNVLMNGFCKKGKLSAAKNLLSNMLDQNVAADKFVYATLIDGFVRDGDLDEAKNLFELAMEKGLKLDVVGYNAMIKGYCKVGKLKDAVSCVKRMTKARVSPDEFTYSTIIDGYVKQHDLDGALGIFSRMLKQNCKPNVVTYTSLISGFCQKGDHIGGEKLFNEMKLRGLIPNVVTYSIVIGSYCKMRKLAKAASFFEQMLASKCKPNDVTFRYLVDGFAKYAGDAVSEKDIKNSMFLDINSKMISDGWSPRPAAYRTIVVCLCLHGMLDISLQLSKKTAIRNCPVVFGALLYGICLERKAEEWNRLISCNLNESELLVAVKYSSIFDQFFRQRAPSEASVILQKLVDDRKSKHYKPGCLEVSVS
ncbi:pentatricopeptide repeat-containing protein At1g52620 [Cynara cardunculus var. scolymus]|uniref:pentatricopeptide repeat-containing protein At1g52620 n=1 Tax=Cynara cardunculus var. scolymus TaxID=59895 RepID=UPI000D62DA70|nr:pentatricopeptide repeat-containing protein At1g52620 [Cynara cardunculus var. scolymus]